ncbi:MAG: Gfo/Idh/MocA family oxidoreductase [Candidatus Omnitrophica bacterium]|nr:Gfo/Idh/MocA family oxidoreductase [Candidatus Omnitrophota bacterium]MCM8769305.1 Gfo/Idh/MocA family oxidoreductase [Candidatus Omnitrophota bacterium]
MKELKAAIIGSGGISHYHIRGYLSAGVKVVAVVDPVIDRAKEVAHLYQIKDVYGSHQELLQTRPDLDLVSVATPNKFHAPVTIDCLNAGRHVFCEKPPGMNANEVLEMKKAAEKNRRFLLFDFNNRARPESQALMNYIRSGQVGRINSAQAIWIRRCGIPGFGGWFTQKAFSGGGPVIDLLHMIDLALYFMDFPPPDYALAVTFNDFAGDRRFKGPWGLPDVDNAVVDVEMAAHGLVTFKTGQVLFIRNSWAELNQREEVSVTFQGTLAGGMLRRLFQRDGLDETAIDECQLYTMEGDYPVNRAVLVSPDPKMGREAAVVNFVETVQGEGEPLSSPDQAVILMKIIDAIYLSAEKREPVKIEA